MRTMVGIGAALGLAGCGILEGSEETLMCVVSSSEEVEDPSQGYAGLEPLADGLDDLFGTYTLDAMRVDEAPDGPFPGAATLTQTGPPLADTLVPSPEAPPGFECGNLYRIPAELQIVLDDGVFSLTVPMDLATADGTTFGHAAGGDAPQAVQAIDDVTTTLDLRSPRLNVAPNGVSASARRFDDGTTEFAVYLSSETAFRGWDLWRFLEMWDGDALPEETEEK